MGEGAWLLSSAASLFPCLLQSLARAGSSVAAHLDALYARYGWFTSCNFYVFVDSPAKTAAVFERLRAEGHYWARLGDLRITAVRDLTATPASPDGWDSEQAGGAPLLPVSSSSQMITYKVRGGRAAPAPIPSRPHPPPPPSSPTRSSRRSGAAARSPS